MPRSSKSKCPPACRVPTIVLQPAPVVVNKVNMVDYTRRPLTRSEEITLGKLVQEAVDDRAQDLQVDLASSQTTSAVRAAFVQEIVVAMLEQRSKQVVSGAQNNMTGGALHNRALQGGELKVKNASLISTAKVSELLLALNALKDQPMSVEAAMSLGELLELLTGAEKQQVADAWKRNDEYSFDAWNSITDLRQKALDLKRCTKLLSVKNDELESNLKKTQAAFGALNTYKDEASEAIENAKQSGALTDAQKQALKRLQAQMSKSADAYQEAQAQAAVLKAEYLKNQQALADAEARLAKAQLNAEQAGQRHEQLLEDCNASKARLTEDLAARDQEVAQAKGQLQKAQADLSTSEAELTAARNDSDAKQQALETEHSALEEARAALEKERAEFDAQRREAQETFDRELAECVGQMDKAVQQHKEAIAAQVQEHQASCAEEVSRAQAEKQETIDECQRRVSELEAELGRAAADCAAQTAQATQAEEEARQMVQKTFDNRLEQVEGERDALQNELGQCEEVRSALQEAILQGSDTAETELSELRSAMQNIERQKQGVDETHARLQQDKAEYERTSAAAQAQLEADLKAAQDEHREAAAACTRAREAAQAAGKQALEDREAALKKACDERVMLIDEKVKELDARYNTMSEQCANQREEAEAKARLVTERDTEIGRLTAEITDLAAEKKRIEEEKAVVDASVDAYAGEIAEAQTESKTCKVDLEAHQAELARVKAEQENKQRVVSEEINTCNARLNDLEAVNTALSSEKQAADDAFAAAQRNLEEEQAKSAGLQRQLDDNAIGSSQAEVTRQNREILVLRKCKTLNDCDAARALLQHVGLKLKKEEFEYKKRENRKVSKKTLVAYLPPRTFDCANDPIVRGPFGNFVSDLLGFCNITGDRINARPAVTVSNFGDYSKQIIACVDQNQLKATLYDCEHVIPLLKLVGLEFKEDRGLEMVVCKEGETMVGGKVKALVDAVFDKLQLKQSATLKLADFDKVIAQVNSAAQKSCPGSTDLLSLLGQGECPEEAVVQGPVRDFLDSLLEMFPESDERPNPLPAPEFEKVTAGLLKTIEQYRVDCGNVSHYQAEAKQATESLRVERAAAIEAKQKQEATIFKLKAKKVKMEEESRKKEAKLRQRERDIAAETQRLEGMKTLKTTKLEKETRHQKQTISELEGAAEQQKTTIAGLERVVNETAVKLEAVTEEKESLQSQNTALQTQIQSLQAAMAQMRNESSATQSETEKSLSLARENIITLKARQQQLESDNKTQAAKIGKLEKRNDALEANTKVVTDGVNGLKQKLNGQIQGLESQIETLKTKHVAALAASATACQDEKDEIASEQDKMARVLRVIQAERDELLQEWNGSAWFSGKKDPKNYTHWDYISSFSDDEDDDDEMGGGAAMLMDVLR